MKEYNLKQLQSVELLFDGVDLRGADGAGQELVKMAGGHPRTLEIIHSLLVQEGKKQQVEKMHFSELLSVVLERIRHTNVKWEDAKSLVASAICRIPVSRTQSILTQFRSGKKIVSTVDEVRRNGYCPYLVKAFAGGKYVGVVPVLTPIQLLCYFKEANPKMGDRLQYSIHSSADQADFCGRPFELFHSLFDAYSRMSWRTEALLRPPSVSIRDFYTRNFDAKEEEMDTKDVIPIYDKYTFKWVSANFLDFFIASTGELKGI